MSNGPEAVSQHTTEAPSLDLLTRLYVEYGRDLAEAREYIGKHTGDNESMVKQFDDLEAEALYLFLRCSVPEQVVEISPRDGWSSTWILKALADNGTGHLTSFDLHDRSLGNVPTGLREDWELAVGDVRDRADQIPRNIDFLLLDSKHTRGFARWYIAEVLPLVRPGAPIVIHDIAQLPTIPFTEAAYVRRYVRRQGIGYFTLNASTAEGFVASRLARMFRLGAGISEQFLETEQNPAIFFTLPR